MRTRLLLFLMLPLGLTGCVTSPIPEGYTGPTATIRDSTRSVGGPARFFYVSEVDGKPIETTLSRARARNYGRGAAPLPLDAIERQLPAKPLVLKLEGRTAYSMPIQEIVMAARMRSVTEVIEFEPKPNGFYVVTGELAEGKTGVWLVERDSGERVGKKVESK